MILRETVVVRSQENYIKFRKKVSSVITSHIIHLQCAIKQVNCML